MFVHLRRAAALAAIALTAAACVSPNGDTPAEKWASTHQMRDDYIKMASERYDDLAGRLTTAPGYIVADTLIFKILLVGTAKGYAVLVDNRDHTETYIDSFALAVGPGIEVAHAGGVFVFNSGEAIDAVKEGLWDFGVDAEIGFKLGDFGGGLRGVQMGSATDSYPLFVEGVALHASLAWAHFTREPEMDVSH